MTDPNPTEGSEQPNTTSVLGSAEIALSDPLKEETRKARLYLLGLSTVGIAIVKTGLVPQEITTLGIKFGEADRQSLLVILALVVLYFLVAFAVYGVSDFLAWRYAYSNVHWFELRTQIQKRREVEAERTEALRRAKLTLTLYSFADGAGMSLEEYVSELARKSVEELRSIQGFKSVEELKSIVENHKSVKAEAAKIAGKTADEELRNLREYMSAKDAQRAARSALEAGDINKYMQTSPLPKEIEEALLGEVPEKVISKYSKLSPSVAWIRALFEFGLPLLVALYAIYALLTT